MNVQIEDILVRIGMNSASVGFWYITDYIELLDDPDWCDVKTTALYEKVASINKVSLTAVQRAISYQFERLRKRKNNSILVSYIGKDNSTSESLSLLHERLKEEREMKCDITEDRIRSIVKEEIEYAIRLVFPERACNGI